MKKVLIFAVIIVVLVIATTTITLDMAQKDKMKKLESSIKAMARRQDMEYLGFINVAKLSEENGYLYYGPGVSAELLRRAGLEEDSDVHWFTVADIGDCSIMKMTVYKNGQENTPVFQKEIKAEYLWIWEYNL